LDFPKGGLFAGGTVEGDVKRIKHAHELCSFLGWSNGNMEEG
jgi:hypothetical protein